MLLLGWLQGFYDRSKLFWKDIDDTTLIAACAPPGTSLPTCSSGCIPCGTAPICCIKVSLAAPA